MSEKQTLVDGYVCADCRNVFVQPPKCTTCGAEKLYDATVRGQTKTIERLQRELAEARPCDHHKSMFESAISALAAIDRELGMPEDGCNEPDATLEAIRELKRQLAQQEIERLTARIAELEAAQAEACDLLSWAAMKLRACAIGTGNMDSAMRLDAIELLLRQLPPQDAEHE